MPRALWWSQGGGLFLMGAVSLYQPLTTFEEGNEYIIFIEEGNEDIIFIEEGNEDIIFIEEGNEDIICIDDAHRHATEKVEPLRDVGIYSSGNTNRR